MEHDLEIANLAKNADRIYWGAIGGAPLRPFGEMPDNVFLAWVEVVKYFQKYGHNEAFSAGRLQGLKEMDEAWQFITFTRPDEDTKRCPVEVLRSEYRQE